MSTSKLNTSASTTPSKSSNRQYSVNYEYRSRDEVANAILKVRGKDKKAEYVNKQAEYLSKYNGAQAQRAIIISKVANKPAEIADAVTHSLTESTGTVEEQEYSTIPSQNNMSVTRSFISMSITSKAATIEEAGEQQQVFSGDTQGDSLRIEHKKKPTNNDTGPKKTNTAGLFVSNVCHLIALLCQLLNKLT